QVLADRILALSAAGWGNLVYRGYNGLIGSALFSLARAHGTLRRVGFDFQAAGETITVDGGTPHALTLTVPHERAVLYLDTGAHAITSGTHTFPHFVIQDEEHVAAPF